MLRRCPLIEHATSRRLDISLAPLCAAHTSNRCFLSLSPSLHRPRPHSRSLRLRHCCFSLSPPTAIGNHYCYTVPSPLPTIAVIAPSAKSEAARARLAGPSAATEFRRRSRTTVPLSSPLTRSFGVTSPEYCATVTASAPDADDEPLPPPRVHKQSEEDST